MQKDDIIRMAREANLPACHASHPVALARFAKIIAAAEREACAKVCRKEADRALWNWQNDISENQPFWIGAEQMAANLANDIRARGNK